MARRAREHLGDALQFCVYDRFRNLVLTIDDHLVTEIIAGRVQIDFAPASVAAFARTQINEARRHLRRAVLANATLYQALQRARGRSFTREDILRIQADAFAAGDVRKE